MTRLHLDDDERAYLDLLHGGPQATTNWAYRVLADPHADAADKITAKAIVHRCDPAPTWPEDTVIADAPAGMVLATIAVVALTSGAVGACIGAAFAWAVTR